MKVSAIVAQVFTAATLSVLAGTAYIIDCRRSGGGIDQCWLTGLPIAGLGGAAGGGFQAGYRTPNPALRRQRSVDDPDG
jgi:hypothetical protein